MHLGVVPTTDAGRGRCRTETAVTERVLRLLDMLGLDPDAPDPGGHPVVRAGRRRPRLGPAGAAAVPDAPRPTCA